MNKKILKLLSKCPNGISLSSLFKFFNGKKDLMDIGLESLTIEEKNLLLPIAGDKNIKISGGFSFCGNAKFGIGIKRFNKKYNRWIGGVLDIKEIKKLKKFIDEHIELYEKLKKEDKLMTPEDYLKEIKNENS